MTGTVDIDNRDYGAESYRWAVFWTPAVVPIIGEMKELQDLVWQAAYSCYESTRGEGLDVYAACIIKERSDRGLYIVAQVSAISSFDPATFVVADSGTAAYQILVIPQIYWYMYKSPRNQVRLYENVDVSCCISKGIPAVISFAGQL